MQSGRTFAISGVRNISIELMANNTVRVRWRPPLHGTHLISHYAVYYRQVNDTKPSSVVRKRFSIIRLYSSFSQKQTRNTETFLYDIKPSSKYEIYVIAVGQNVYSRFIRAPEAFTSHAERKRC